MCAKLKLPVFIRCLSEVEDKTSWFANRQQTNLSPEMQYLFTHILVPILEDKEIRTEDLDMDRFDLEDIQELFTYYQENYTFDSPELALLNHLFRQCVSSQALCCPISYI